MIYIAIAIATFAFVAYQFMLIDRATSRKRNNRSRHYPNATMYRGQTFNRHGRAID